MADAHAAEDPTAAPMHHEIHERFSSMQVALCAIAAVAALAAGLIAGILLANN